MIEIGDFDDPAFLMIHHIEFELDCSPHSDLRGLERCDCRSFGARTAGVADDLGQDDCCVRTFWKKLVLWQEISMHNN